MIRPSSLSIAKHCALSPVLSERYPSTSVATERGSLVDARVMAWISPAGEQAAMLPDDPDAKACCEWLAANLPDYRMEPQKRVELRDSDTGAIVTAGTADIVATNAQHGDIIVIDLKKREQYDAGRLADPDDNDQLHAYALASTPEGGSYHLCLLLFGGGRVEALWSQRYAAEAGVVDSRDGAIQYRSWDPILARIVAVNERRDPNPKGNSGDHCAQCYPRIHCPHWAKRTESDPDPADGPALLLAAKASEENAKRWRELARDAVDYRGPFRVGAQEFRRIMVPGRVTVDSDALEQAGLYERFSRVGRAFPQYKLTRPTKEEG